MASRSLSVLLQAGSGPSESATVEILKLVIAGWTGRDLAAVEHHIRELEAIGVKRPASVPVFYRVSCTRLTTDTTIEVLGNQSSGEVEFVLLKAFDQLWVGAGSDHTDREAETYGVALSKQLCEKPVAPLFWAFDDVANHWDRLILRSHATIGSKRGLYQEGSVSMILPPADLLSRAGDIRNGTVMFCGTLAAIGGVRVSERFDFELEDPVHGRKITHGYEIHMLPVADQAENGECR